MSIQAYQQAAKQTANPRDLEFRLFAQVTRALTEAKDAPRHDIKTVMDALDWNRRVWSAMAMDCARETNSLPEDTRAGIISLSIFVSKHTSVAARKRDEFDTLIEINRNIMGGLAAMAEAAGQPISAEAQAAGAHAAA